MQSSVYLMLTHSMSLVVLPQSINALCTYRIYFWNFFFYKNHSTLYIFSSHNWNTSAVWFWYMLWHMIHDIWFAWNDGPISIQDMYYIRLSCTSDSLFLYESNNMNTSFFESSTNKIYIHKHKDILLSIFNSKYTIHYCFL